MMQNMLQIMTILVLLHLHQGFSGTVNSTTSNCTSNEVGILVNGREKCWAPQSCPIGHGLTVKVGKRYPAGTRISCDICQEGSTYSDVHDLSQCKNCKSCGKNEFVIGQCDIVKDYTVCKCKAGYFRSNATKQCKPCSSCCSQSNDDCSSPEAKKCFPETRCPQIPSSNISNMNIDTNNTENKEVPVHVDNPNSERPTDKSPRLPVKGNLTWILFIVIPVTVSISLFVVLKKERKKRCLINSNGNNQRVCVAYNNQSSSSEELHSVLSTVPLLCVESQQLPANNIRQECDLYEGHALQNIEVPLLCVESQQLPASNIRQERDLYEGPQNIEALIHETREIPSALDSSREYCIIPTTPINTAEQAGLTDVINTCASTINPCSQYSLVTQLPNDKLQNICNVLDDKDDFYRDYRMLAQELGMEESEISLLKNTSSPTYSILETFELSLERFLDIIETCFITQSSDSLANVSDLRTAAIANMVKEVKPGFIAGSFME